MKMKRRILAGLLAGAMACGMAGAGLAEWKEETRGGKVSERTWVDENGLMAVSPEGYTTVTYSYSGTTVTELYYDAEGEPAPSAGGFYGRQLTYGNKHRLEEVVYLDGEGHRMACAEGYARVKIIYTAAGGVTQASYYDEDNALVTVPSLGYAQLKNDYRGTTLTKTTYLDERKEPVDTPMGYAVMIQSVNKSNRVTGIRFEHADGSPAVGPEGWASMKRELDKKHREISVKYYDLSGKMTDRGLGYAYEQKTWESPTAFVISRFDLQDRQIPLGDGYVLLRREMNKDGQVIRETFLDEKGNPTENAEGVQAREFEYDDQGRLAQVRFENARGEATENRSGAAGYRETLDGDGFVTSRVYLGKGGSPVNISAGYSEVRYLYDAERQVSRTEYYDVNGSLVKTE